MAQTAAQKKAAKAKAARAAAAKAKADDEPERITSIEIKVRAGATYGLDLLKLSVDEAELIEEVTGEVYGRIVHNFYFGEALRLKTIRAIAATAIQRVDDEKSFAQILRELGELPVGGDDCLKLERVDEDDAEDGAVDPTLPGSGPTADRAPAGSQN